MKTIKDLTPEIEAKIPEYIEAGLANVFDGGYYKNFDIEKARACVKFNYEECGFKEPQVIVAENPYEIFHIYKELLTKHNIPNIKEILSSFNYSNLYLFTMNVNSNCSFQWYKFIRDEFNLPLTVSDTFDKFHKLQKESGIYCALFLEDYCIVSKYPKMVHRNTNNDLHNVNGNAVEWGYSSPKTKWECHYVNGRHIESSVFNEVINGKFTFAKFKKLENEDLKGIIMSIIRERDGNDGLIKFLKAKIVDSKEITHENGYTEKIKLYKTKETFSFVQNSKGELNQPYAWIHMVCPSKIGRAHV